MESLTPSPVRSISRTVCTRRWSDLMLSMAGIPHVSFERDKILPDEHHEKLRYFIHLDPGHDYERMLIRRIHAMQPHARIIGWICANTLSPDTVLQLLEAGIHGILPDDATSRETNVALIVDDADRLRGVREQADAADHRIYYFNSWKQESTASYPMMPPTAKHISH